MWEATVYANAGQEVNHTAHHLGVHATAFGADLAALVSAIGQAQLYINRHPATQVTIYATNPSAIQAITNLRPHLGQTFSRNFCSSLTQIFIFCIDLARANATTPLPLNRRKLHTIAHQQATSRELAIATWQARDWHNAGQVFLALPDPPSGKPSPAIQGAAGASRKASSTFIRMATGHAFLGLYYARFHPRKPTHCPGCGSNPQSVAHIIQSCPRFARARASHLSPVAPDLSLAVLFGTKKGGNALIKF